MTDDGYVVHFGVVPNDHDGDVAMVAGHDDPRSLGFVHEQITVDGSWAVWGSDDPDVADEHDGTLHVVFNTTAGNDLAAQIVWARGLLWSLLGPGSRLLDFALVTTGTWSEKVGVFTTENRFYTGRGEVSL